MFPTDNHRNESLAPLLADIFQELLDRGTGINKAQPESQIAVECVGDSRDAGPTRASSANSKEGPAEGSASAPASFSTLAFVKGQRKKSILTSQSKANPLYKAKLRQRLRLLFAPDADTPSMSSKQAIKPTLGSQLMPSKDGASLETRLDALTKRVLMLETNLDSDRF